MGNLIIKEIPAIDEIVRVTKWHLMADDDIDGMPEDGAYVVVTGPLDIGHNGPRVDVRVLWPMENAGDDLCILMNYDEWTYVAEGEEPWET